MSKNTLYLLGLGMLLLTLAACNDTTLTSDWRTPELKSNNPDSAWAVTSTYSWKDENILLGLQNDADRLVILLKTRDRATQMTILRAGLTIWLDPTGQKNKTFGIHYPIGRQGSFAPRGKGQRPDTASIEMKEQMTQMPDSLELIRRSERVKAPIKSDLGVTAITSNAYGTITYLISVPIKVTADSAFGINAAPGSTISLGFETGNNNYGGEKGDRERPGEGPEGGYGGRGGFGGDWGGGGRGQGRPPGMGPGGLNFEPVDFWTKVILATEGTKTE
jgi:hypothetical protein